MKRINKKLFIGLIMSITCISLFFTYLYKNNLSIKAYKENNNLNIENLGLSASQIENKNIHIKIEDDIIKGYTMFNTVSEALESLKISIEEQDKVTPSLYEKVSNDMEIEIVKVTNKMIEEKVKIPYKSIVKYNTNLEIGKSVVAKNGVDGVKNITKKLIYENGELALVDIVDEYIEKQPVDKVIEKGTKDYFMSSRGKTTFKKTLTMSATAYDLSYESTGKRPGDAYYGITASGSKARPGVVAVDPKVIPLGTKLYIKGYGFFTAEDTGGAIKGNKIDIYMENRKDVLEFGRRSVKVYILK